MTTLPLLAGWLLAGVDACTIAIALLVAVLARRSWRAFVVAIGAGALVGAVASWWFGDVLDVLEVSPSWVDRIWVGAACALLAASIVVLVRGSAPARVAAVGLVVLSLVSAGLAVNRDAGLFPTVADALGQSHVAALRLPDDPSPRDADADSVSWKAPSDMPRHGRYGSVRIPGTESRFRARPGIVYLPPAALVQHAPRLPVVVMLSGQGPGAAPTNVFEAGRMAQRLDRIAAAQHGLAPIVVVPDQLGEATRNPMCVDGPLGNSQTYLTRDVPSWIRSHLHVEPRGADWAIAGFSQGGTCAVQLGAGFPELFGSFIDVSGQRGPTLGDHDETVQRGFRGDAAAYAAAQPARILAADAPYPASAAFFGVGADDDRYGPQQTEVAAAARRAGIAVTEYRVPDSGHDWHTAGTALEAGLEWLEPRVHLARAHEGSTASGP